MSAMQEYRKRVREASIRRTGEPIYNGSADHAAVLTETLFEIARSEVRILTGKLDALIYGGNDVLEKARAFLSEPGKKVKILVEQPELIDAADHPFIREFSANDDLEVRRIDKEKQQKYHFTVVDDDSYRFERDKSQIAAVAAFGHPDTANKLVNIFNLLWDASERNGIFSVSSSARGRHSC